MENEEYGIKLRLLTSGFKTAMRSTARETKMYGEEMQKSTTISPKASIALLGIVGALSLMASATNKYIKSDKQLQGEMKLTSQVIGNMVSALGNALSPAIKGVINIAEYAIIVLAKLIQLFTGFNALENINNDNLDKTTKKAKAASKALAGFDTLTTLSSSSGGGVADDIDISTDAMETFKNKIAEVDKIFQDYAPQIKLATATLAAMFGVSMLGKIAKVIGMAGAGGAAGTGLAGVAGLIGWIGAIGALAIEISLIIKGIDDWKKFVEWQAEQANVVEENNKKRKDNVTDMTKEYKKLASQEKRTAEEERRMGVIRDYLLTLSGNMVNTYDVERQKLTDLVASTSPWSKATKEQVQAIESIIDRNSTLAESMAEVAEKNGLTTEEARQYITELTKEITAAENAAEQIKYLGGDYETATQKIDAMKSSLSTIISNYGTKIVVDADTKNATDKLTTLFNKFGLPFGKSITASLNSMGINTNKLFDKLASYDVGTNYVPQDQLAIVHKGEMIVPAKYNPITSGIGGNEETNYLLRQLNTTLEQKEFNGYISAKDITDTAINGINQQSRIMGRSVIK